MILVEAPFKTATDPCLHVSPMFVWSHRGWQIWIRFIVAGVVHSGCLRCWRLWPCWRTVHCYRRGGGINFRRCWRFHSWLEQNWLEQNVLSLEQNGYGAQCGSARHVGPRVTRGSKKTNDKSETYIRRAQPERRVHEAPNHPRAPDHHRVHRVETQLTRNGAQQARTGQSRTKGNGAPTGIRARTPNRTERDQKNTGRRTARTEQQAAINI